jgi:hypothetical protein
MKRKLSTETPVCPQERLVIISYIIGLSFALERIGPLTAITIIVFYLLVLYLLALLNTPENLFASIYSESLIKTACQHLLLLIGFDTLIYRKYYDTPLYLWVISYIGRYDGDFVENYGSRYSDIQVCCFFSFFSSPLERYNFISMHNVYNATHLLVN